MIEGEDLDFLNCEDYFILHQIRVVASLNSCTFLQNHSLKFVELAGKRCGLLYQFDQWNGKILTEGRQYLI